MPVPGVAELLEAAKKNDVYELSRLLEENEAGGLRVDSADPMERTALHEAAKEGSLVAAKFLLTRGAHASPKDSWGATPLDDAIKAGHKDVRTLLVDGGGALGSVQETAEKLFAAIGRGELAVVESLVTSGCPIDCADSDSRTPLHHAAASGDLAILDYLIGAGAKVDALDMYGLTPIGEAARHASRTGENKVRDRLIAAGADTELSGESRKQTYLFIGILSALQVFMFVLFACGTVYAPRAAAEPAASAEALKTTYSMFMDVHVMIFIGFGFLMTFLRKYGHSSVGLNFLVAAFVIQWHILCGGFFEQAFHDGPFHKIAVSLNSLLLADFASAVVLITFGALLGKVSPLQLIVIGFLETILFSLNEQLLLKIGILDVGGSIIVHLFGAYFGLAASWVLSPKSAGSNNDNASVYHSDLFAMIGTIFLWVYWPSFVASPAGPNDQERAIIATTLALTGSCIGAFITSLWLRRGKFSMVDVLADDLDRHRHQRSCGMCWRRGLLWFH